MAAVVPLVPWSPESLRSAAASVIAPAPPSPVVSGPGPLGIPAIAMAAYQNAERLMAVSTPGCGMSWNLLAGIGRIESLHAFDGATDPKGNPLKPIFGPALDGSLPGNEVIVQGRGADGQTTFARAMGPMQFLPSTWTHYAADGNGDGDANPQNIFDASLAAARYLCSGGLNMRNPAQAVSAVLRYNNSTAYTQIVLGWAKGYVTGVAPVNLPSMSPSGPSVRAVPNYAPAVVTPPAQAPVEIPKELQADVDALSRSDGSSDTGGGSSSYSGGGSDSIDSGDLGDDGGSSSRSGSSGGVTIGNGRSPGSHSGKHR